jgi:hypothetical protein
VGNPEDKTFCGKCGGLQEYEAVEKNRKNGTSDPVISHNPKFVKYCLRV